MFIRIPSIERILISDMSSILGWMCIKYLHLSKCILSYMHISGEVSIWSI